MARDKDEIILLIAKGYKATEIGKKLSISSRTVENHIKSIKKLYKAKNAANLVAIWLQKNVDKIKSEHFF